MITIENAKQIVQRLFEQHPTKNFSIRLWDGSIVDWGKPPTFTLVFHNPETFTSLIYSQNPALFGEAFMEKNFDIEGDVYDAIALSKYLREVKLSWTEKISVAMKLGVPKSRHSREEDARDVQAHYDLSNDFYRLFLDKQMVYSCAYFSSPTQSLEEAQERKLDLICKKLRLKPGESFLDIGCGWGALVMWAAKNYGVKAQGITLSKNQFALAQERVKAAGLENQVTIELKHYADLPKNTYDKIASIGMIEHVGFGKYSEYFAATHEALKAGGLFLNHGITTDYHFPEGSGGEFITKNVFPGSELDHISRTLTAEEEAGFEILDVEQLRPHYALTLREWAKRFMSNESEAAKFVPEKILRIWKLYLPGCALAFEQGLLGVYQELLAKQKPDGSTNAPLTREDIQLKK